MMEPSKRSVTLRVIHRIKRVVAIGVGVIVLATLPGLVYAQTTSLSPTAASPVISQQNNDLYQQIQQQQQQLQQAQQQQIKQQQAQQQAAATTQLMQQQLNTLLTAGHIQDAKANLKLQLSPAHPQPGDYVVITAQSTLINLSLAKIYWYEDDVLTSSGVGDTKFSFTASYAGKATRIHVVIDAAEKIELKNSPSAPMHFERTLVVQPEEVSLLWEAETYTPPFYRGKALPTPQSTIRVIALPHVVTSSGSVIPPAQLVYTWKVNGEVQGKESGYGKHVLLTPALQSFATTQVSVDVSSTDGTLTATKDIRIPTANTKIVFYRKDPLGGTQYNNAISNQKTYVPNGQEITVHAVPYFFSVSSLHYLWMLNNTPVGVNGPDIVLNAKSGVSRAILRVKSARSVFQMSSGLLNIAFPQQNTASLTNAANGT